MRDDPDLDRCIEEWTVARSREDVVAALRDADLRVAPVETISELATDAQLVHRGFWRRTAHPVLGTITAMAPPFLLSHTPAVLERAGPTLGEHNEEVWRGLLGLSDGEYRALASDGVFD
jgi:crotonobetainyl-CoA:carnitine CoA-transferase CaiB-like acyl-CoA transferase